MSEPEVTEADREKAHRYWLAARYDEDAEPEDVIAAALAAERAKARAPFLALVSEYGGEALSEHFAGHTTAGDILRDIQRAAEEPEHIHRWADVTRLGDAEIHLLCTLPGCGARRTEPRT